MKVELIDLRHASLRKKHMFQKIPHVDSAWLVILESFPPKLLITSVGQVPSSGWSKPHLVPYVYVTPPADGIWDFDFIANSPDGIALPVIMPIGASLTWDDFDEKLVKGVRIHAARNHVVRMMDDGDSYKAPGGGVSQISIPILRHPFVAYAGVDLEITIDLRRDGNKVCAKIKVKVKVSGIGSGTAHLPEVCLSEEGLCTSVDSGGGDVRASAEVCWRGNEICANVTGKIRLAGRWYEKSKEKCEGI